MKGRDDPAAVAIPENISEKFAIPSSRRGSRPNTMFAALEKAHINRELYDIRVEAAPSSLGLVKWVAGRGQQDSTASEEQVVGECGSLKMALVYDARLSLLTVSLHQAAELVALREDAPPNPYFKVPSSTSASLHSFLHLPGPGGDAAKAGARGLPHDPAVQDVQGHPGALPQRRVLLRGRPTALLRLPQVAGVGDEGRWARRR